MNRAILTAEAARSHEAYLEAKWTHDCDLVTASRKLEAGDHQGALAYLQDALQALKRMEASLLSLASDVDIMRLRAEATKRS